MNSAELFKILILKVKYSSFFSKKKDNPAINLVGNITSFYPQRLELCAYQGLTYTESAF